MKREEEIKKQADIYTDDASNYAEWSDDGGWSDSNDIELIEKAFIEGAKWADEHPNLYNEGNINFKHELEYYLYILNDKSLTYQDKVEVLEKKIKDRIKNM